MSTVRTDPYYVGKDLRRHRPELFDAMKALPDDLTVYVVIDGWRPRTFRCVIRRGSVSVADTGGHETWESAWHMARAMYERRAAA